MAKNLRSMRYGVIVPHGLWKHGISPKAIGLLCVLLGLADIPDWEFSVTGLASLFDDCETPGSGVDAINSGIAELERGRFLVRSRVRKADGTLGAADWLVSPVPMAEGIEDAPEGASPVLDFPGQVEPAPIGDFPRQENQAQYKKPSREQENPPRAPFSSDPSGENAGLPKLGRSRLKPSDLPESLAPVAERLAHWWNTAKGGSKSRDAYKKLLTQLEKIRAEGGIEALAEQIEKGILAKEERGRGWESITYSNWVQYAPRETRKRVEERARAMKPTHEQQEMLDLIQAHPDLFQASWITPEGRVRMRFTSGALHAAREATNFDYPEETAALTMEAVHAEIAFLREAMGQGSHGLDKSPCPF